MLAVGPDKLNWETDNGIYGFLCSNSLFHLSSVISKTYR